LARWGPTNIRVATTQIEAWPLSAVKLGPRRAADLGITLAPARNRHHTL
jgi:hypothetical protein